MKYEGASSESDDEPEDKSRQGFSPAPPHFKRPNVLTMTPQATSNITMPSPRGVMQVSKQYPTCLHLDHCVIITRAQIYFKFNSHFLRVQATAVLDLTTVQPLPAPLLPTPAQPLQPLPALKPALALARLVPLSTTPWCARLRTLSLSPCPGLLR